LRKQEGPRPLLINELQRKNKGLQVRKGNKMERKRTKRLQGLQPDFHGLKRIRINSMFKEREVIIEAR
jgi:hypothetical protein